MEAASVSTAAAPAACPAALATGRRAARSRPERAALRWRGFPAGVAAGRPPAAPWEGRAPVPTAPSAARPRRSRGPLAAHARRYAQKGVVRRSVAGGTFDGAGWTRRTPRRGPRQERRPAAGRRTRLSCGRDRLKFRCRRRRCRRLRRRSHKGRQDEPTFLVGSALQRRRGRLRGRLRRPQRGRSQPLRPAAKDDRIVGPRLLGQGSAVGVQPKFAARRYVEDGPRINARRRAVLDPRAVVDAHVALGVQFHPQFARDPVTAHVHPGDAVRKACLHGRLLHEDQAVHQEHAILRRTVLFRPRGNFVGVEDDRFGVAGLIAVEAEDVLVGFGGRGRDDGGDLLCAGRRGRCESVPPVACRVRDGGVGGRRGQARPGRTAHAGRRRRPQPSASADLPANGTNTSPPRLLRGRCLSAAVFVRRARDHEHNLSRGHRQGFTCERRSIESAGRSVKSKSDFAERVQEIPFSRDAQRSAAESRAPLRIAAKLFLTVAAGLAARWGTASPRYCCCRSR